MITTHIESFTERLPELEPLLPLHYEELALDKGSVPLDPDFDIYRAKEAQGGLLFVTLRKQGELVGYFIGFIAPGLHYRTCLTCQMDIFYVHPDHRGVGAGAQLFQAVERELRRRKVQRWYVGGKAHSDVTWLFERLGFAPADVYYSKMLDA